MTRGRLSLAAGLLVLVAAVVVVRVARSEPPPPAEGETRPSELVLLVVNTDAGPFTTVIGARGSAPPAALVLPGRVDITIPGQGDGTIDDAVALPLPAAATAAGNLLGVPIAHNVSFGQGRIEEVVDRAGGIEIGGTSMTGSEVVASLLAAEGARDTVWEATLEALLRAVTWEAGDVPQAHSPTNVASLLNDAKGASVEVLPTEEVPGGLLRTDADAIRRLVTAAWGMPDREVLPIIVLNGSGAPGIGEAVAEKVIPGGFRVVISENASDFDHETTAIVVASEEDRVLGERVRDLLGVGEVQVAGPASGLADVTVVVGKDFAA